MAVHTSKSSIINTLIALFIIEKLTMRELKSPTANKLSFSKCILYSMLYQQRREIRVHKIIKKAQNTMYRGHENKRIYSKNNTKAIGKNNKKIKATSMSDAG